MPPLINATNFDWPVVAGACGAGGPAGITPDQWTAAEAAAVDWLWALSGRQFGVWTVVWRPEWTNPPRHRRGTQYGWGWGPGLGSPFAGTVPDAGRCDPTGNPSATTLPGPVVAVSEVLLDGVDLDSADYLLDGDQLIRTTGTWPVSQDVTAPTSRAGTWQVTYTRGRPVPVGGQAAAGILACELAQAMVPGGKCALPANVTSVARNGVTISKQLDQLNLGFTGLFAVDQWVRTVNPKTRQSTPDVWSPDLDASTYPTPAQQGS